MYVVDLCKRGRTARSIKDILWKLKRHSKLLNLPWISQVELDLLTDARRGLGKHDHSVPKRKLPITSIIIEKVASTIDSRVRFQYQLIVMMMVAHDALLRGSELTNLNVLDVTLTATGAILSIIKSKANKTGPPEPVIILDYGKSSAAYHLRKLIACSFPALPQTPLFPDMHGVRRMSKPVFSVIVRQKLAAAGYASAAYSAHSFRSGGATDLYHNNCRPLYIKFQGRWKSDAYIIYIRDHPDKRSAEAARAFKASTIRRR
jgi:integrase